MPNSPLSNALGDLVLALSLFYVAYDLRENRKVSAYFLAAGLLFVASSAAFVSGLDAQSFYTAIIARTVVFTVLFVESMRRMLRGLKVIRRAYALYLLSFMFVFYGEYVHTPAAFSYATIIIVSYLIVATVLAFMLTFRKRHMMPYEIIGFLGAFYPLLLVTYDVSAIFDSSVIFILPSKLLLSVFFVGFGYHVRRDRRGAYDYRLLKFSRVKDHHR